ncbi:hypothetical protein K466DRAFT_14515 [Polyporus arcularius HHB13444]|uniref:Uncharacterized protein n=1 Tax=Polyporus arcularius HHB13444 TaxID=1314778 RepID=A0A5C3PK66_9APHY|nr:hypothetical protein K466DRAFT_14515 [Polyporus arcularius HHB13444]
MQCPYTFFWLAICVVLTRAGRFGPEIYRRMRLKCLLRSRIPSLRVCRRECVYLSQMESCEAFGAMNVISGLIHACHARSSRICKSTSCALPSTTP